MKTIISIERAKAPLPCPVCEVNPVTHSVDGDLTCDGPCFFETLNASLADYGFCVDCSRPLSLSALGDAVCVAGSCFAAWA